MAFQLALLLVTVTGNLLAFPSSDARPGILDETELKRAIPSLAWATLDGRMSVVAPRTTAEKKLGPILRVDYPRGAWGSEDSGAQFLVNLPPAKKNVCEYFVRFTEDFDFVRGGKLPGLAGGAVTSGLHRPTGDGWTARYMWRPHGDAVLYLYHMDQAQDQGDDLSLSTRFSPGRWYHLKQIVRVNDSNQRSGSIQVWVDGKRVLEQDSLRLQTKDQAPVDRFYFSTFFGGGDKHWAPTKDSTIEFARIRVFATDEPGVNSVADPTRNANTE